MAVYAHAGKGTLLFPKIPYKSLENYDMKHFVGSWKRQQKAMYCDQILLMVAEIVAQGDLTEKYLDKGT